MNSKIGNRWKYFVPYTGRLKMIKEIERLSASLHKSKVEEYEVFVEAHEERLSKIYKSISKLIEQGKLKI